MPPPLPPILYHIFPHPLPYLPTLALQNHIHVHQLSLRRAFLQAASSSSTPTPTAPQHPDMLLLLQHRPVYTAGRRETEGKEAEMERLQALGADWVKSDRGGLTTYHGPGQLVGYPLWDIGRMGLSARCFVNSLENSLRTYLLTQSIRTLAPSPSPGLFLTRSPTHKIASLGISIRHRLTAHGFSLNVTPEPLAWFGQIVACGLEGVSAGCVADELAMQPRLGGPPVVEWEEAARGVVSAMEAEFGREFRPLMERSGEPGTEDIREKVLELETVAQEMGPWEVTPRVGTYLGPRTD